MKAKKQNENNKEIRIQYTHLRLFDTFFYIMYGWPTETYKTDNCELFD